MKKKGGHAANSLHLRHVGAGEKKEKEEFKSISHKPTLSNKVDIGERLRREIGENGFLWANGRGVK